MNWLEILNQIFELCIIPLLGILSYYLIQFITIKGEEAQSKIDNDLADKYIKMATETVVSCVKATNQTYVDSLKATGAFDVEAQKKAFDMTKNAVLSILTAEAQKYLTEAVGDLNIYINQQIEAAVKDEKLW